MPTFILYRQFQTCGSFRARCKQVPAKSTHSCCLSFLNIERQHQHKKSFITMSMIQWYSRTTCFKATMKITQQKWSPKTGGPRNGFIYIYLHMHENMNKMSPPSPPPKKGLKEDKGKDRLQGLVRKDGGHFVVLNQGLVTDHTQAGMN